MIIHMGQPTQATGSRGTTRIFGFPLHLRPGFFLFMALIVLINGNEFGVWLAGAVAVVTLVHELGHALVARAAGAKAEISLDFLAGYASYVPTRPLARPTRAAIAFAGPAIHIVFSTAVLVAMGANPLDTSTIDDSPARFAVFWAGPVIGLFNLLPILPLDGGNIVETGLNWFLPEDSKRVMLYASIAITVGGTAWLMLDDDRRSMIVFAGVILLMQLQMLYAGHEADDMAWMIASDQLRKGDATSARRTLEKAVAAPAPMVPPPAEMDRDQLSALIANLGARLPVGNPSNEYQLAERLLALGQYERAAFYAADTYRRHRGALVAATVARAANAAGDPITSLAWLRTAVSSAANPSTIARVIDQAPELGSLRSHPEVIGLRRSLDAPTA
ncbi:hypothetical protein BH20ACT4_BH20ACT4_04810 [soil metagenome]